MENFKRNYIVVNVFKPETERERKLKVNKSIENLCNIEIEKMTDLDYNKQVTFHGSVSEIKMGGTLK